MKKIYDYWTISIEDAEPQWHLFALQSKGDCYLSANTKIVGFDKAVQLSSKELALAFRECLLPTLRPRHGDAVIVIIRSLGTTKMRNDDELVAARIRDSMFAPNKRPASVRGSPC